MRWFNASFLYFNFYEAFIYLHLISTAKLEYYIFSYFNLTLFSKSEFVSTDTELKAIAPPAIIGFKNPVAAKGIPIILYINAQNKFCFIFLIVAFESFSADTTPLISPFTIVISAVSIAISVPVPIAIPISAAASAGASFIP